MSEKKKVARVTGEIATLNGRTVEVFIIDDTQLMGGANSVYLLREAVFSLGVPALGGDVWEFSERTIIPPSQIFELRNIHVQEEEVDLPEESKAELFSNSAREERLFNKLRKILGF